MVIQRRLIRWASACRELPIDAAVLTLNGVRAVAACCIALVVALTAAGCAHPTPAPPHRQATLTATAVSAVCSSAQLVHCVPGLADIEPDLFDLVSVRGGPDPDFAVLSPSSARDSAPPECQNIPAMGAAKAPEIDAEYRPAAAASGTRFPANGGEYFHVRFMVAENSDDLATQMNMWANQCRMWSTAPSLDDNGVHGWMIAESADKLTSYESGDSAQWPFITHVAATKLPNGVIAQAFYRTTDPSATSRNHVFSAVLGAVGRPRTRAALPPSLADWDAAQISTLLPPLDDGVTIDASAGEPGGRWLLCPDADRGSPLYDLQASWSHPSQGAALPPSVRIARAGAGVDYLSELRREIATCTAHLVDKPALCSGRDIDQVLDSDSAVADGVDTVRVSQRWLRVQNVQGYDRCVEGAGAFRIAQLRGLIVISSAEADVVKGTIGNPTLPLSTLDELAAQTVHAINTA
ncbi:hypothetical protein [Mycolicibacterium sp. 120322]|uniref:hypothetical protein n=1 Tax=Mycolicibacterium sp. 120322 TaxID=3096109 RepID=UPI002EDBA207